MNSGNYFQLEGSAYCTEKEMINKIRASPMKTEENICKPYACIGAATEIEGTHTIQ